MSVYTVARVLADCGKIRCEKFAYTAGSSLSLSSLRFTSVIIFHIAENTRDFVNINRRLLWESQETGKCNVWSECRGIGLKGGG